MAKKLLLVLIAITLVSSLALIGCASKPAEPTKVYEIRYAHHLVAGGAVTYRAVDWWVQRVEELSNGQIHFTMLPGGQMGTVLQNLGLVQSGTVDMSFIPTFFYAGQLPLYTLDELPFKGRSAGQQLGLWKYLSANSPALQAHWNEYNQFPVARSVDCPALIHTTKKQVLAPADMNGLKFRCAGGAQPLLLDAVGAVGMTIGVADTYMAMQTGVVDGNFVHAALSVDFKWYEVTSYTLVTDPPISMTFSYQTINLDYWNNLPKKLQDVMLQAADDHDAWMAENVPNEQDVALDTFNKAGVKITYLTKEQTQPWIDAMKGVEAEWLKEHPDGKELLDMANKWLQEHPE